MTSLGPVAAVTVGLALLLGTSGLVLREPSFVEHISIGNDSEYDVRVEASENGVDWMAVGVAAQDCVTTVQLIVDQGPTWHLRFRSQGRDGGTEVVERAALERAGWTYTIPGSVIAQLHTAGAPVPPPRSCAR